MLLTAIAQGLSSRLPSPAEQAWCATKSWPFVAHCPPVPSRAQPVIGMGNGWEIGWAAHRERWTRLIALHRWLGAAHHVDKQPLYAEMLDYDCIRALEMGQEAAPWARDVSNDRCWGDPGNGVQVGWFVRLLRRKLGILQ